MRRLLILAAAALAIGPLAMSGSIAAGRTGTSSQAALPPFGHVFLIIGENKSLFQLTSGNAPYIMKTLKPRSAWFTNYKNVARGSAANYVALTSGQFDSCETTGPCTQKVPSIFSQLGNGKWKDWNESMPSNCYRGNAGSDAAFNPYKPGHNPALTYIGLSCSTYDVPAGTTAPNNMEFFNGDLAKGTVPKYNLITPNLCEASYHACTGKQNIVTEYDNFLRREIPLIEASPAFGSNSVIFVTYDEGYVPTHNFNTMMAVTGPQVRKGTYAGAYNHYSAFATMEKGLGLRCLAHACSAKTFPIFAASP